MNIPDKVIVAGNVVTPEMTEELIINGADVVKIGIGPGTVYPKNNDRCWCTQFSAILDCADAVNGVDGHIMADGGCVSGDIAKAFGGGAPMVMIGGMLAGHDESKNRGRWQCRILWNEQIQKEKCMAKEKMDTEAMKVDLSQPPYIVALLKTQLKIFVGGVRSACTYIGARRLKDMPKCASFVTVHNNINRVYERYTVK